MTLRRSGLRPEVYTKVGCVGTTRTATCSSSAGTLTVSNESRRDGRPEQVRRDVLASCERLGSSGSTRAGASPRLPGAGRRDPRRVGGPVREGRVRAVGVSNFEAEDVRAAARALGDLPLVSLQSPYSLLDRGVERGSLAAARSVGAAFSPIRRSPKLADRRARAGAPLRRRRLARSTPLFREVAEGDRGGGERHPSTARERARGRAGRARARVVAPSGRRHGRDRGQSSVAAEESLRGHRLALAAELARLEARFGLLPPSPSVAERVRTRLRGRPGAVRRRVRGLIDRVLP
ncbi:MAG: aldo/keto reductase [Sandaracinus sp.]|nr:aldo/keto reductase [Sandaracinus sp.]